MVERPEGLVNEQTLESGQEIVPNAVIELTDNFFKIRN